MTDSPNNTIASITDTLAEKVRELGRQAREHGERLGKACDEYAARLLSDQQDLSYHILQADEKVKSDIAAFIGTSKTTAFKGIEQELRGMTKQ